MIRVKDLQNSTLPKEFVAVLPKVCDVCGADTEVTDTLTALVCSNPNCKEKGVQRLVQLLKDLNIKNMGESKCRSFLENFDCTNPYGIFVYDPNSDGTLFESCSMDFSESIYAQINEHREMLLWEYVKIGNIPGIRDIARHLFKDYTDLEQFYEDMEEGGIPFIQDLLGIKGKSADTESEISVKATAVYETLLQYKGELTEFIDEVKLKTVNAVLNVCISSNAGGKWKTKSEFKDYVSKAFADTLHINFLSGVTKDCDYLIWGGAGAKTSKVKKAESYGIPVVDGDSFIKQLEAEYK